MTEMLAALLGAVVGGVLSAWVGSRQTAKVLKHETDLAKTERQEAHRLDEERRRSFAADQLIAALADFTTVDRDGPQSVAVIVRVQATQDVHRERTVRATALLQAGSAHMHALPAELHSRWEALTWMVRFCQSKLSERPENLRRRDANDLLNYIEYLRRSLCAVSGDGTMLPDYPAPDVRRERPRPWGVKPDSSDNEPDLTDWFFTSQMVGEVKFTSGELRWYGPNGLVEELGQEPPE